MVPKVPEKWPIYFAEKLIVGDIDRNLGIVTLWTERDEVAKRIRMDKVSVVGQLYSKNQGISVLLRNILARPLITEVIIFGVDKSGSGRALLSLAKNGIDRQHQIIGEENAQLDKEIPLTAIEAFRKKVVIVDLRDFLDYEKLNRLILRRSKTAKPWQRAAVYADSKPIAGKTLPSERTNFVFRGAKVVEVWPRVLAAIMDYGTLKKSQHANDQKELINVIMELNEDPDHPQIPEWFGFTRSELEFYYDQIVTGKPLEGIARTYGQRMFDFGGIDQIQNMIEQLKQQPYTRRAVAVLWEVPKDYQDKHCPCFISVQGLVQEGRLYLTAYLRSSDAFRGWPRDVMALRRLQAIIAKSSGYKLGTLTTICNSSHIYADCFAQARKTADCYGRIGSHEWRKEKQECVWREPENDLRGSMLIELSNGEIVVSQRNQSTGELIREYRGISAISVYNDLLRYGAVSRLSHAFDLGCELQKAELALRNQLSYIQDKPLII